MERSRMSTTGRCALGIALLLSLAGCRAVQHAVGPKVLGFENLCASAIEVTAGAPTAAQPTHPWVRLEPNANAAAGRFAASKIAIFIRSPGAETAQVYVVRTSTLIRVVGGNYDLLVEVQKHLCPA